MTYIKLEDVQNILEYNKNTWDNGDYAIKYIEKEIYSLPSIDFEEMIKEMIKESKTQWSGLEYDSGTLEIILNKLHK